jgi:hypothetical protein
VWFVKGGVGPGQNAPLQRAQDPPLLASRCVHAATLPFLPFEAETHALPWP